MKLNDSEGIGLAIPMTTVCAYLSSIGIDIDTNGNVVGNVGSDDVESDTSGDPSPNVPNNGGNNGSNTEYITEKEPLNTVLLICLIASVVVNVVLLAWLMIKFYGNRKPKLTEKDRTDFDIDILE